MQYCYLSQPFSSLPHWSLSKMSQTEKNMLKWSSSIYLYFRIQGTPKSRNSPYHDLESEMNFWKERCLRVEARAEKDTGLQSCLTTIQLNGARQEAELAENRASVLRYQLNQTKKDLAIMTEKASMASKELVAARMEILHANQLVHLLQQKLKEFGISTETVNFLVTSARKEVGILDSKTDTCLKHSLYLIRVVFLPLICIHCV